MELIDKKIEPILEFRNNKLNKKKGKDGVLTLTELQNKLVVGDQFGVLGIWEREGEGIKRERKFVGHSFSVRCSTIVDRRNGIVASGSEGELNSIRVWNIHDGICLATLKHHKETVSALVCLQNILVSASHDGQLCLWDLEKKELIREVDAHGYPVLCLEKSLDEKIVVSGGDDYCIRLWDTNGFGQVGICHSQTGSIISLCMLDDSRFASGSYGGQIKIWSFNSLRGGVIHTEELKIIAHKQSVTSMTYLSLRNWLVSVSEDRSIRVWHCKLGSLECAVERAHKDSISCITHFQDEATLATGCWDGLVKLWRLH